MLWTCNSSSIHNASHTWFHTCTVSDSYIITNEQDTIVYNNEQAAETEPKFGRNILAPSSELNKLSKVTAWKQVQTKPTNYSCSYA
jgi:hypothetical protein